MGCSQESQLCGTENDCGANKLLSKCPLRARHLRASSVSLLLNLSFLHPQHQNHCELVGEARPQTQSLPPESKSVYSSWETGGYCQGWHPNISPTSQEVEYGLAFVLFCFVFLQLSQMRRQSSRVSYSVTRIGGGSEDFSFWTASHQKPKGSDGVGGYVQLLSKLLIPVV